MKGVIFICALLAAAACSKAASDIPQTPAAPAAHFTSTTAKAAAVFVTASPLPPPVFTEIKLERKGCYGSCPIYAVDLQADDTASYTGERNVDRTGHYNGQVPFDKFALWLASQNPSDLEKSYGMNVIDAESIRLTLVSRNGSQTIDVGDTSQMPSKLYGIALAIDGLVEHTHWAAASDVEAFMGTFVRKTDPDSVETIMFFPRPDGQPYGTWNYTHIAPCSSNGLTGLSAELDLRVRRNTAESTVHMYQAGPASASSANFHRTERWTFTAQGKSLSVSQAHAIRNYHRISYEESRRASWLLSRRANEAQSRALCNAPQKSK